MSAIPNYPSAKVELTLSAIDLKDKDLLSKSDPCCVVFQYVQQGGRQGWKEIGRTETIMNCIKPEWNTKIYMDYFFEERQKLKFEIYDIDDLKNRNAPLINQDFLGRAECELAEIIASNNGTLVSPLKDTNAPRGRIVIHAEEIDEGQKEVLKFKIHGKSLDKKDLFGKSDPFLNFYRLNSDGSRQLAYRTEVIKNTSNPEWKPFDLSVRQLCQGDKTKDFLIECFDYDNDGGLQLDFTVAVDFTASNGTVTDPRSLHYINPHQPNQYEMAIRAVLDICQFYNKTKMFDAYGFGAKIPPTYQVSHLFPLNVSTMNSTVHGVEGVMEAYRICLNNAQIHGPTNFSPVINAVAQKASYMQQGDRYQILLIITDGVITDMQETLTTIIHVRKF
uniref:C2 domain-containing protein n=1 Tax=Acrobeloides nanus TaxID=290746 RepID=A0A914E6U1_9BILA